MQLDPVQQWHVKMGVHSNIPMCCIMEWVLYYDGTGAKPDPLGKSVQYVRCSACRTSGYVVKIKRCNSHCWERHNRAYNKAVEEKYKDGWQSQV